MIKTEEYIAKEILEKFVNSCFSNLTKGESPDWFSDEHSYGLEIVRVEKQEQIKLSKSLKKKQMSKGELENLQKQGRKTPYGFISHTIFEPDDKYFEVFKDIVLNKNDKLLTSYKKYKINDLFVFAFDPLIDLGYIKEMVAKFLEENTVEFNHLMVLIDNVLIIFETSTRNLIYENKISRIKLDYFKGYLD